MDDFERLGVFYLGRLFDAATNAVGESLLLYDSKDLTTHAVCVGMTGSGKTGLCLSLLEEAAIDGIPVIAVDPKGDLGNLLLAFPGLRPADFRPWIDEGEAARRSLSPDRLAEETAEEWRKGLAQWGQDGARIERFRRSADAVIYTPGSRAGLPVSVLRSFGAPPAAVMGDVDLLRDRVSASASGLLSLLGLNADPVRSREHILISHLLEKAWREGRSLDMASLIAGIQAPPFPKVGVMDVDAFFPPRERMDLSLSINNLLASPAFQGWLEGDPLDLGAILHTPEGKPRLAVFSIAHLSDPERMFFVTLLLNEVLAWVRGQPGTSSLRAVFYMDEVFGFLPPVAEPPSKKPLLTLLKQARASGLGIVLATQNPVDLDYKGLSNAGTWFLGRLQTERDKDRVLEGLEGASATAGRTFDRARLEATLAGLKSRVFLMNNVHEDAPVLFHTRWALSYLAGPMSRSQIQTLMAGRRKSGSSAEAKAADPGPATSMDKDATAAPAGAAAVVTDARPLVPPEIRQCLAPCAGEGGAGVFYRPALLGAARLHYVKASPAVDHWEDVALLAFLDAGNVLDPWAGAEPVDRSALDWPDREADGPAFGALPAEATRPRSYAAWKTKLAAHLYWNHPLKLMGAPELKLLSRPGEGEGEFRVRLSGRGHAARALAMDRLEKQYVPRLARLRDQIMRAEQQVSREQSQLDHERTQTMVSVGATLLGAVFGRRLLASRNIGRATTAVRGAGRAAREQGDVARARERLSALRQELLDIEAEFRAAVEQIPLAKDPARPLQPVAIPPRKSDIVVSDLRLAWIPTRPRESP